MATTKLQEFNNELLADFIDKSMDEISKELDAQQLKKGAIPKTQEEKEQYIEQEKEELMRLLGVGQDKVELAQKGLDIVLNEGKNFGMSSQVLEKVKKSGEILFGDDVLNIVGKETLQSQEGLKEKLGLTDEDLVQIYKVGFACYEQKKFQDAIAIFYFITVIDYLCFSPWLMSGICLYELEEYNAALDVFRQAIYLKHDDPIPHFYSIFSLLKLGEKETANKYLDWALNEMGPEQEANYEEMIQLIKKQINSK